MKNLLEMVRAERHRRSGSDEFFVVIITNLTSAVPVHVRQAAVASRRAQIGATVLKKSFDESMEAFEARATAEAKAAGNRYVVITEPVSGGPIIAEQVNGRFLENTSDRRVDELTDNELLVLATGGSDTAGPRKITDADIEALARQEEPPKLSDTRVPNGRA
jgi:hypothetical protein